MRGVLDLLSPGNPTVCCEIRPRRGAMEHCQLGMMRADHRLIHRSSAARADNFPPRKAADVSRANQRESKSGEHAAFAEDLSYVRLLRSDATGPRRLEYFPRHSEVKLYRNYCSDPALCNAATSRALSALSNTATSSMRPV
jgi:hypothetical protein